MLDKYEEHLGVTHLKGTVKRKSYFVTNLFRIIG